MTDPNVNREFLNTLLASNLIWSCVSLVMTGLIGLAALLWRRRYKKRQAAEKAEVCLHCRVCHYPIDPGHRGRVVHAISNELCGPCAASTHNAAEADLAKAIEQMTIAPPGPPTPPAPDVAP